MAEQKQNGTTVPAVRKDEPKKLMLKADFGDVYCKVQSGQLMAPIKADITLFAKAGHLYDLKGKTSVSAVGYRYLNKVAAISLLTPQFVIVDGQQVPNPHIERHPKTRAVEAVALRKMGIGYSPAGNIVVMDKTLNFNIYTYFMQDLQSKMKQDPKCAVFGIADEKPEAAGKWAFFLTQEPLGIWINYENPLVIEALNEHTQRQKFGERIATTIVERNILRDHPAIAVSRVEMKEGGRAFVTVHGWRNDAKPHDLSEIMKQAESGKESADFEVQAEVITEVKAEDIQEATEEAVEGDAAAKEAGAPEGENGGLPFGAETVDKAVKKSGKF